MTDTKDDPTTWLIWLLPIVVPLFIIVALLEDIAREIRGVQDAITAVKIEPQPKKAATK